MVQRHGPYREWGAPGQLATSGTYKHDQRDGVWLSWHRGGALAAREVFRDDNLLEQASWWPNHQLRERGKYDAIGRGQGVWESFSSTGRLVWRRSYSAGVLHGQSATWDEAGQLRSVETYRGNLHGPFLAWSAAGWLAERGEHREGHKHGLWSVWEGKSLVRQGRYFAGNRHGAWRFWHASGELRAQGKYRNGRVDGPWIWWHADGRTVEGSYGSFGCKVGPWWSRDAAGVVRFLRPSRCRVEKAGFAAYSKRSSDRRRELLVSQ
jgi:antitoxin component YwqK of YwqJK toxin-antitoxin module